MSLSPPTGRVRGARVGVVLSLLLAVAGCSGGSGAMTVHGGETCGHKAFEGGEIQTNARPFVVRLKVDGGSGTGFVLYSDSEDETLIATNNHVIAEADTISMINEAGGKHAEVANLEVVKVDTKADLALLRAPRIGSGGLRVNADPVILGQRIAAMGFPYVKGSEDFSLTFEPGDVTALDRKLGQNNGQAFIQTNANINPGNSGGPVMDACGSVVGIVTAVHTEAQRVGLVVPVSRLLELHERYKAPRPASDVEIRSQLEAFGKAVHWKDGDQASSYFSRSMLSTKVFASFKQTIGAVEAKQAGYAKVLAEAGIDYKEAPPAQKIKFLQSRLPPDEFSAFVLLVMLAANEIGAYQALQTYLSTWVVEVFGEIEGMKVAEVLDATKDRARARVDAAGPNPSRYEFQLVYERGDWRIADMQCIGGGCAKR